MTRSTPNPHQTVMAFDDLGDGSAGGPRLQRSPIMNWLLVFGGVVVVLLVIFALFKAAGH